MVRPVFHDPIRHSTFGNWQLAFGIWQWAVIHPTRGLRILTAPNSIRRLCYRAFPSPCPGQNNIRRPNDPLIFPQLGRAFPASETNPRADVSFQGAEL